MAARHLGITQRIRFVLGNKWTWCAVVGLFALHAVWLALFAQYPLAFDENYHFGLVQLHAQQWLPWFDHQPPDAGQYGAIVRDPSYLFHWLLSFPYRLLALITHSQTAQIIVLRLLNVGLFVWGLYLYRQVLKRFGVSAALMNSLFAVFVLIPVVPFLAAHINYDNLLMVAVPLTVLLGLKLLDGFAERRVDAMVVLQLVIVILLSSLIKYPYLPVAVVAVLFLVWRLKVSGLLNVEGWRSFASGFWRISRPARVALVVVGVIAFGLFAERYAVNVVRYHTPVPACDAVISLQECVKYGPFGRDHAYEAAKSSSFHPQLFDYIKEWFRGMWYRMFFAINHTYFNLPPLPVMARTAVVMAVLLLIGIIVRFHSLFSGHAGRQLVAWIVLGYALVLFVDEFQMYAKTAVPVAINGRYFVPFLLFAFALGGLAWSQILRTYAAVKAVVASVVIAVLLLQGGGALNYVIRSSDDWYWPNQTVRNMNGAVRAVVSPTIIGK